MSKIFVPPIKCQGIKTKLVPWILEIVRLTERQRWIEPFMGSGVVGFNCRPASAFFADKNPHLIRFYRAIQVGEITPTKARAFLEAEGERLRKDGQKYFKTVRMRFNETASPWDFLFLNRSCFNGLIRFNSRGGFNTPYNHKPERFDARYISKIANQIDYVQKAMSMKNWDFVCADFRDVIPRAQVGDVIYCDPPYLGRHVDYFDSWSEEDEHDMAALLAGTQARFLLSTWHSNQFRRNESLERHWGSFTMKTRQHFYHVGAKEENRNPMLEALVMNFEPLPAKNCAEHATLVEQLALLEKPRGYTLGTGELPISGPRP